MSKKNGDEKKVILGKVSFIWKIYNKAQQYHQQQQQQRFQKTLEIETQ